MKLKMGYNIEMDANYRIDQGGNELNAQIEYQSYEFIKTESFPGIYLPKINHACIYTEERNKKLQMHKEGKWLLVKTDDNYCHLMTHIGAYLILKEEIPDLQIGFLLGRTKHISIVHQDIMSYFGIPTFQAMDPREWDIHFEQIYVSTEWGASFMQKAVNQDIGAQTLQVAQCLNRVVEEFKPFLKKTDEKHKIFSSRKLNNLDHISLGTSHRTYSEGIDIALEGVYEESGYKIMSFQDTGLFYQLNMFYNASHVAGVAGTGLMNTMFSDPDTEVDEYLTNRQYWSPFKFFSQYSGASMNWNTIDLTENQQFDGNV